MSNTLNREQQRQAIELLRAYLAAPRNEDGRTLIEVQKGRDVKRLELIKTSLLSLLKDYLSGNVVLEDFKSQIDSLNKRNTFWGFKGAKGQMFFNMLVNAAGMRDILEKELKAVISAPTSEAVAAAQIRHFSDYVKLLGEKAVAAGRSYRECPNAGSVPFFISYFWQVQEPQVWPVYYTNSVRVLGDINLWQPKGDSGHDYLSYKQLHEELSRLFSEEAKLPFGLYEVEHVFWFKGGNPYGGDRPLKNEPAGQKKKVSAVEKDLISKLPESYLPPIIQIIPRLAKHDDTLADAAQASGTTIPTALEKCVHAAFTILGYSTQLLGQGQGRVPDGLAVDHDDSYAIIWDAKARSSNYSMGTDDRTIREYIVTQSRDLKKKRGLRNVYYVIVSCAFSEDYDEAIKSLKMETDISEVILLESEALVEMVNGRLRSPLELSLGPEGLQRLFVSSGVLKADDVRELL